MKQIRKKKFVNVSVSKSCFEIENLLNKFVNMSDFACFAQNVTDRYDCVPS